MPYNSEQHARLSHVDKPYKVKLTKLRTSKTPKITEKAMLEHLIEQAAKGEQE